MNTIKNSSRVFCSVTAMMAMSTLKVVRNTKVHSFSSQAGNGHWLDRFEHIQQGLERMMRTWWIKGVVESRCKTEPLLQGHEALLKNNMEKRYQEYLIKYSHLASIDSRARVHVSSASLVLATHAALSPFLRDENKILEIIKEHHGSKSTPLLQFLLKATSILHRNMYKTLQKRLRGLQLDYGPGFRTHLKLDSCMSTLRIESCIYHSIFEAEDKLEMLSGTCCQADTFWLDTQKHRSTCVAGLASARSRGDPDCVFFVRKL